MKKLTARNVTTGPMMIHEVGSSKELSQHGCGFDSFMQMAQTPTISAGRTENSNEEYLYEESTGSGPGNILLISSQLRIKYSEFSDFL